MSTSSVCPECGTPLEPDSPQSLCPACLLRQALASRTAAAPAEGSSGAPPPAPEEIAAHFPQFEIVECLGRGGMGVVYKARQKSLDRWVAIKILAPERVGPERFAERFQREAHTLARLSHPNIVTVFDHGETGGWFYIVMEYIDGVNLRDLLRDGRIEPAQALAIVPPVCAALQYAHDKGIVHRDIKPENLLIDREGRVKIADFGIASMVGGTGERAGTPPYMAPEQDGAGAAADHRADIYALGVVLYEMLTGERPGRDLIAPSRKVQIDVRLDEIVLRALDRTPELRFQTADEFRTVVASIAPAAFAPVPPPSPASTPDRTPPDPSPRIPSTAVVAALCAVPALLIAAWLVLIQLRFTP
jgi:serine/threonine protein kinase